MRYYTKDGYESPLCEEHVISSQGVLCQSSHNLFFGDTVGGAGDFKDDGYVNGGSF